MSSWMRAVVVIAVVGVAGGTVVAGPGAWAGSLGRQGWGRAIEVPGTAALNRGGSASVRSVSCAAVGNCSAGGQYLSRGGARTTDEGFVVSQVHGIWGTAMPVPGLAALNRGGSAQVSSVSCAAPGGCAAGGFYDTGGGHSQAFVVSQVHGVWGRAARVPGLAALNRGGYAYVRSVSCAAPGECAAGGYYARHGVSTEAFVVSQVHSTWGRAVEVPGTAALNRGGYASVASVSCAGAGSCAAGGYYEDRSGAVEAFVVSRVHGVWGTAAEVPGTAALNQKGWAQVNSVSCAAPGDCAVGGEYAGRANNTQAFVASQARGTWGKAIEVPGLAALNQGGVAVISSLSCAAPGDCAAGGSYANRFNYFQSFVATQIHGTWGTAAGVPISPGGESEISSLSCATAGTCTAGGFSTGLSGSTQAFVVSQARGTWGKAIEVPGTTALNQNDLAGVSSVSCPAPGGCAVGGSYQDSSRNTQAFVDSQN